MLLGDKNIDSIALMEEEEESIDDNVVVIREPHYTDWEEVIGRTYDRDRLMGEAIKIGSGGLGSNPASVGRGHLRNYLCLRLRN